MVFSRNVRSDTCNFSPTWLPKHKLNKNNNRHASVGEGKTMMLHKELQALRSPEVRRNSLPHNNSIPNGQP